MDAKEWIDNHGQYLEWWKRGMTGHQAVHLMREYAAAEVAERTKELERVAGMLATALTDVHVIFDYYRRQETWPQDMDVRLQSSMIALTEYRKLEGKSPQPDYPALLREATNYLVTLHSWTSCKDYHHEKSEYHIAGEDCPVQEKLDALIAKLKEHCK